MHQFIKFILFWNDTVHVSDGLSVHHQEFKTVHTAIGICQTDTAVCLLASRQRYLFDKCLLLYVQTWTAAVYLLASRQHLHSSKQTAVSVSHMPVAVCTVLNCWWWTERPSVTCRVSFQNKINLIHWCIWLGLLQKYTTMHGSMNVKLARTCFVGSGI